MKTLLLIILLSFPATLFAPVTGYTFLPINEPVVIYDILIRAIRTVESGNNDYAFNFKESSRGPLQIRKIRLDDYNRRTGKNYQEWDCYDFEVSREIFLHYCKGWSFEEIAKSWNGSGKLTIEYWKKVNQILNN
jgi:hypothetical protein